MTPSTLYAGTNDRIFKSLDGGENWIVINTDLTDITIYALAVSRQSSNTLYAGTNKGVFTIQQTGVK
jgi:hypothetical protein